MSHEPRKRPPPAFPERSPRPKSRKGPKPYALELRDFQPDRWWFFPEWEVIARYRTERDARQAFQSEERAGRWLVRITGPEGVIIESEPASPPGGTLQADPNREGGDAND